MNALLPLILEAIIKYGPSLVLSIITLCQKKDATEEDWRALQDRYKDNSYESYVKK